MKAEVEIIQLGNQLTDRHFDGVIVVSSNRLPCSLRDDDNIGWSDKRTEGWECLICVKNAAMEWLELTGNGAK